MFAAKERPLFDPLIVHVTGAACEPLALLDACGLVDLRDLSATAMRRLELLLYELWPGPLTVVLPRTATVPDLVTSGQESVGDRSEEQLSDTCWGRERAGCGRHRS